MAELTTDTHTDVTVPVQDGGSRVVDRVQAGRVSLGQAMAGVAAAAAAPLSGRATAWRVQITPCLEELRATWGEHIAITEGVGGLFEQIRADAPRLAAQTTRLHLEHEDIQREIDVACSHLSSAPPDAAVLAAVSDHVQDLLRRITRHRQRGADLLYEAYQVDIGSGE